MSPLIDYTPHFIRAAFSVRVPVLSVLGLPFQTFRAQVPEFRFGRDEIWHSKVIYTSKFIRTEPIGTRAIFIRSVPKIFGSTESAFIYRGHGGGENFFYADLG